MEKSLRLLFEKKDVSLVKAYVQKQFMKIIEGNVTLKDYTFAKEYRGMSSYKPGACVPALLLTRLVGHCTTVFPLISNFGTFSISKLLSALLERVRGLFQIFGCRFFSMSLICFGKKGLKRDLLPILTGENQKKKKKKKTKIK